MKSFATLHTHRRRLSVGAFWLLLVASCVAYFSHASDLQSKPDGSITGRTSTTSPGCDCHGFSPTSTTVLSVASSSGFTVDPGATVSLTLTVANSSKVAAGTDIGVKTTATGSASAGTLAPGSGSGLQLNGNELTHLSPKSMGGTGQVSFAFNWTAPSTPGVYYIQAAGNAVDLSNTPFNDQWNWLTPVQLTVPGLEVSSPNTSVTWCTGTTQNITWAAVGVANVKIEVAPDGSSFTTLVASTPASAGSWPWAIPSNQALGTQYRVRITDAANPARNDISNANLTIQSAPTISTPPVGQNICAGQPLSLSVTATGTSLSYQWKRGGNPITGATSPTYSVPSATATDGGVYEVVVTNACTSIGSTPVTVNVNTPPAITSQPTARIVCAAQPVTFTVVASGSGLTYQWRKGGTPITGETNASLNIAAVSVSEVGEYDVVVSGSCPPSVTSTRVPLTLGESPAITTQPSSQAKCQGQPVTFSVTATGAELTYQWRKGTNIIPSATEATYTIPSVGPNDAGNYSVVVGGLCPPGVTSEAAVLTVNPLPTITTQPADQAVLVGSNVTFSVAATGGTLTYQWKKGGVNLDGKTGSNLTLNNVQNIDAADYTVLVQNACGNQISSAAHLTVIPPGAGALISINPSQISFGTSRVGTPKEQVFTDMITNTGDSLLKVTAMTLTGANAPEFAIVDGGAPFDLAKGASRNVTIKFTPADTGARTATLEIASNAKNTPTATLQGQGARSGVSTTTMAVNFNTVRIGESKDSTIVICNDGSVNAVVAAITSPDDVLFHVASTSLPLPATLAPGECLSVVVRFTPSSEGLAGGSLRVDLDGQPDALTIVLAGMGETISSVPMLRDRRLAALNVAPNPTTDEAAITVNVARSSRVELSIADMKGRTVRTLLSNELMTGTRTVIWDGRGSDGNRCPAGAYSIVVRGGGEILTTPVILVR